jgi:endonuclease/exonuclease/phosphatase family metal-dependent hydrolase
MWKMIFIFLLNVTVLMAQQIILDENRNEWHSVSTRYSDPATDASAGKIDFGDFYITNDDKFVYFLIDVGAEINLQSDNSIALFIDTDNNTNTGAKIHGTGADFVYYFGERRGYVYNAYGESQTVFQHDIGLVTSPTVTSRFFEIMLDKECSVDGIQLFPSDTIRVVFANEIEGGDFLPNEEGGYRYVFDGVKQYSPPKYSLAKSDTTFVRVMTYNVHKDDLFDDSRKDKFRGIFQAVSPDIIGLQEIYNHSAEETLSLIEEFLPSQGFQWHALKNNNDIIAVSKFPIVNAFAIDGNTAFLIDMYENYGKKMLFVVAHPPCCGNDDSRQKEIDHIMAFIRDAKSGQGELKLEENSPIVIVGDMNLVGKAQQQHTLLDGNIINEDLYGADFTPDWDGTNFDDVKQITTGMPATFTWDSPSSSYSPGRLDYIIYSGAVMELKNSFALFTPALPVDTLSKYSLESEDVFGASDHLPSAADFLITYKLNVEGATEFPRGFRLGQNFPNPVEGGREYTSISFSLPRREFVELNLYNVLGEKVTTIFKGFKNGGKSNIKLDVSGLVPGVYFYSFRSGIFSKVRKMVILK